MYSSQIRTDLALEAHESVQTSNKDVHSPIHGVEVQETYHKESNTQITRVFITTKNGAKAIGKPMGRYITIEAPDMAGPDEGYHREIAAELAHQLHYMVPALKKETSILVVGLGNRDVTADALGPYVIDNLCITRHILREYGKAAYNKKQVHSVSSLSPGVMAQNGMETAEIIKGVIEQTKPKLMLVVDALAARNIRRLSSTIQLTDTGILPGSGVGNHRNALTEESLGIPVIAIGVPTVVDAATIVRSVMELPGFPGDTFDTDKPEVQKTFHDLNNMYVTGKDIDETIKRLSYTISEALNMAFEL
ncbi:MAG: GPR endopeptidase [Lachnospiraceae bacterium]|nr:GPR endopeptidase [Lachnospiraceae bacterium]